jgi:hypothetical protein
VWRYRVNLVGYKFGGKKSSSFVDFVVGDAKIPFLCKFVCQPRRKVRLKQKQKRTYISNTPSSIVNQGRNANNTAFDAMLLQKSSYAQDFECSMASARGDLVWRVGGGVGYRQGRWNWRVDMNVGS